MSRVDVEFNGSSVGAVTAANAVAAKLAEVREQAKTTARDNITARVQERQSLEQLAAEYTRVAQNAKRGSETQIASAKLAQQSIRELGAQHGVYSKQLSSTEKELEKFTKGTVVGSGVLGRFSRSVALASGGFLGGLGAIAVMKSAVSAGSALEKQLERTGKVFGENAKDIEAWSETSAKALGLARSDTLDAANTIGTLLNNMGVAPAKSAAMSKSMVQLASDMAAFKGVKPEDALTALESGLQGRTRTLKQFGIVLDQTTIKQEAERLGLVQSAVDTGKVADAEEKLRIAQYTLDQQISKHGAQSVEAAKATIALHNAEDALAKARGGHAEALTNEQKALATYQLLMQQTANQQGTWAKRSGDLAGQEQILHAQIKDLEEELGTALIPQLEKYLPMVTSWIDRNEKNGNIQRDMNKAVKATGEVVGGAITVAKNAAKAFGLFGDAVGGDKKAIELLAAFMVGSKLAGAFTTMLGNLGLLRAGAVKAAAAIGTEEGAAAGGLLGRLGLLARINPIVIPITLAVIADETGLDKWMKDLPGEIKGAFTKHDAGSIAAALIGKPGHAGVVGNLIYDAFGTPTSSTQQPQAGSTQKILQAAGSYSGGQYVWGGGHGGTEAPNVARHTGLDCSGFISQVFTAAGFKGFSGTSETLLGLCEKGEGENWYAQQISGSDVEAGDVAFANNASHVGLVVGGRGATAKILAYSSPNAGGTGNGEKVDPMSSYWGPFYRIFLVKTNTSGHSNDPVSDAGGGNRTPVTTFTAGSKNDTTTTTTTKTNDTTTTTFHENTKTKKKADPLSSYRTAVKTAVSNINDDVDKGLLPQSIGDRLQARAAAIQKSLQTATKADIPAIRTRMKDLNAAVASALTSVKDQALLGKDENQVAADVKGGLLSKSVGDSLIAQAKAINARLVQDIFSPKKEAADQAAAKGFQQRIAAMLAQATEARQIGIDVASMNKDLGDQLDQALGQPVQHATGATVEVAREGIARIQAEFAANKILPKAEQTKLKQQLSQYEAIVKDGITGMVDAVNTSKSKLETAWGKLANDALTQFDQQTQDHLTQMQRTATKAIAQLRVTVQGAGFSAFDYGTGDQTPTQKLVAQLQAQHDAAAAAAQLTTDQAQLSTDQAGGATADQLLADQKQIDDDLYQQKLTALQAQADLEQQAADKQLTAAQDAAQQLEDQNETDYQRQRDQQRTNLQQMFDDELAAVEAGKKTIGQAMSELGDTLGENLATAFANWFDPSNPASVAATLVSFLYAVNVAKGQTPSQAAVGALGSLPPASYTLSAPAGAGFDDLPGTAQWYIEHGIDPNSPTIPASGKWAGAAGGGWAGQTGPRIDSRDTIPTMLRRGEYVSTPEDIAARRVPWASGSGGDTYLTGDIILDGKKVGSAVAVHVTSVQERQISYPSSRA